jgi:predicted nucleic acid-binding protein
MKLKDALSDRQRIFFDTAPVIYFVERHPQYFPVVEPIFQQLDAGAFVAVTSPITLSECLMHPIRDGMTQLQEAFETVITFGQNTSFVVTDVVVSRRAAELRVRYGCRLPDALQIATALVAGCDGFLTNDLRLKQVTELNVLAVQELER